MRRIPAILLLILISMAPVFSEGDGDRQYIVPIYFQQTLYTTFDITEVSGRQVDINIEEYRSDGHQTVSKSHVDGVRENDWWDVIPSFFISGLQLDNGWARITCPANRELHIVSTIHTEDDPQRSVHFGGVVPSKSFRLMAWYFEDNPRGDWEGKKLAPGQTALVIVNPTGETQTVTVTLYLRDLEDPLREMVQIEPLHSLSRFLSELVPVDEHLDHRDKELGRVGFIRGLVEVSGETVIAVGALDFFRESGRFRSVPVSYE